LPRACPITIRASNPNLCATIKDRHVRRTLRSTVPSSKSFCRFRWRVCRNGSRRTLKNRHSQP